MDARTRRRIDGLRRLADHPKTEEPLRVSARAKIAELEARERQRPTSADPIADYLRRHPRTYDWRPAERYAEDMRQASARLNDLLRTIYGIPPDVDISAPVRNGNVQEVDTDDDEPRHVRYDADPPRHVSWRYNADGSVHVIFRTGVY